VDETGRLGPYVLLKPYAASGQLVRHPLVMDALLKRLPHFKTQHSRAGDLNWDAGLPELLLSCPALRRVDLIGIDEAATNNVELRWMRQRVAEHPSVDIEVLESMLERETTDDEHLAALIEDRLTTMRATRSLAHYRAARRQLAEQRLDGFLERTDPIGFAIRRFHAGRISLEDTLEQAGAGPSTDDGLVGGGKAASAPDASDLDAEDLPAAISPERAAELEEGDAPTEDEIAQLQAHRLERALDDENADQFDVWKLVPKRGRPVYALTWRDWDGRPVTFDGLYESVGEVRTALGARYDAVEVWFNDDA
jgi:hypothetical protein